MMIRYPLIIILISLGAMLKAQNPSNTLILILKNNISLEGKLISIDQEGNITFEMDEGRITTVPKKQIKKVVQKVEGQEIKVQSEYAFAKKKLINTTRFGYLKNENSTGYSLSHTVFYQAIPNLLFGIGGGIDNFYADASTNLITGFGEIKYHLLSQNRSPFVSLRGGYAHTSEKVELGQLEASGGVFINPTVGYRLLGSSFTTSIYCGLRHQNMRYKSVIWNGTDTKVIKAKRLEMGIVFEF